MEPIYGKSGQVIGWFDNGELLNLGGTYAAFVHSGSIISYKGNGHIGWFEDGAFWDSHFRAIGILRDSTASVSRPGFGGTPGRPGKSGKPGRPGIPGTPGKPGRSNSWSELTWDSWTSAR